MSIDTIQRIFQVVVVGFCIFMVIGGGFAHRERVTGGVRTTVLTMYPKLPPAPEGPSYCGFLDVGDRGLVLPCNYKPPFIGWLQGGKY